MMPQRFYTGDLLVYRRTEFGTHPAPDARNVAPSANGEGYTYCVTKYWLVMEQRDDQTLIVETRGGHHLEVNALDPNIRKANLFERLWVLRKFHDDNSPSQRRDIA